jgi:hypothetical protein
MRDATGGVFTHKEELIMASTRTLTDYEEIRKWAEARNARPACVKGTGGRGDIGMIRLDFPGYSGEESLQPISWEDWFEQFDENGLALIVQDRTAAGEVSNFNKLVRREQAAEGRSGRAAAAAGPAEDEEEDEEDDEGEEEDEDEDTELAEDDAEDDEEYEDIDTEEEEEEEGEPVEQAERPPASGRSSGQRER